MTDNKYYKYKNLLQQHLFNVLNIRTTIDLLDKNEQKKLPFYLKHGYQFFLGENIIHEKDIMFTLPLGKKFPKVSVLKTNIKKIKDLLNREVVLIVDNVPSYIRSRLIKQGINFIVPGKQLHMPDLYIQLDEKKQKPSKQGENLSPSSQVILLYYILNKQIKIEEYSFKDLSRKFNYSAMAITNAVKRLDINGLCEVVRNKEKHIYFARSRIELWDDAINLLISPVKETWYAETIPETLDMLKSNLTALAEYTDINPENTFYYALDSSTFKSVKINNTLKGLNKYEGKYCFEIWKYDPFLLINDLKRTGLVDPLSLYLSLKHIQDERVTMALDQLKKNYVW